MVSAKKKTSTERLAATIMQFLRNHNKNGLQYSSVVNPCRRSELFGRKQKKGEKTKY